MLEKYRSFHRETPLGYPILFPLFERTWVVLGSSD